MSAEIVVRIAIRSFLPWKVRHRDYCEIASAVTDLIEIEQASAARSDTYFDQCVIASRERLQ
jgi:hypothetical protein